MKKHSNFIQKIAALAICLSFSALWQNTSAEVAQAIMTQQRTIDVHGVVTDATGPLPGVNVMIPRTTTGTLTDGNGAWALNGIPVGATLEFSFMGYTTQTVIVGDNPTINVNLREDTTQLEELVVIGYGTVKKSDLTGSVASISAEDMTKSATGDALQAIQGRAAGVQVITATGDPSATAEIKIRGTGSPNGSSPLYVVDGFPMEDINYLSPNDIESLEILKDASATAIYGSRGANGVVLITTKQGESGRIQTRITAEYGIEALPHRPVMLNSTEYAQMVNKAYENSGLDPIYTTMPTINTDWYNEVMRIGRYQNYNATITGGTERIRTMFSTTFFRRDGTVKSTEFQRLNFTQNTTMNVTSFLTLTASLSGSFAKSNSLGANGTNNNTIFLSSLIAPPDVPVWDETTDYYSGISVFRLANPAGVISRNNSTTNRNTLLGNFSADLKIYKDLTFTSRFGYKLNTNLSSNYSPIYYETANISDLIDTVEKGTTVTTDWTWENILTWHHNWNDRHDLTIMAAMSAREYSTENYRATKQGLPSASKEYWYFDAASQNPQAYGDASELAMLSYLGRINYNLLDRYLFTASFRADGSSRFIGSNRWGYFPSGAFAWKVSEEPFFKDNVSKSAVSDVKFRIGWGQIGNERIRGYYPYMTGISQQQYYTIGSGGGTRVNGSEPSGIGNPEVMWETSEQFNVGLDLAFLDSRLTFTGDYYIRSTDNILLSQSIPRLSGFGSMTRNVGGMDNRGVELAIGWKDDLGDFSYSINGNVSFNKNTVTDLGTSNSLSSSFAYDYALIDFQGQFSNVIRSEVGHPYGQFWGYQFLGIFQNQEQIDNYKSSDGTVIMPNAKPGDSIYADLNDDGKISDADDMTFIGDPNPKAIFGLSFDAQWKNFDLSLLFQGVAGNQIFNASKFYFTKFDGRQNVLQSAYMAAWDGEGSSNTIPIMLANTADNSRISQNWWQSTNYIEDGSYLRLKNLQIGYTFKFKVQKLAPSVRIYLSAQNLLTITKYSGIDPEIPDNGIDRGQYPQPRTFMLGANINF